MTANESQHCGIVLFLQGQAGGVAANFQRGRFFGFILGLGIALDGDDLPATAKPDFFRSDG
jgi:hypothetical protein